MILEQADEGFPVRLEVDAHKIEADESGLALYDAYGLVVAKVDFILTRFNVKTAGTC